MKLENKVAIVTGAGSGMGKAIAGLFAKEGAKVIASDINETGVKDLIASSGDIAGEIVFSQTDVSNRNQVETMIDLAVNKYGKLDVLVNNAGVLDKMYSVTEVEDEFWDKVMSININSVMYACRKAIPIMMKNGGGSIINTASVGGLFGCRAGAAYTASKFAVVGLTKNIGFMYAKEGIRCNAIAPTILDTPGQRAYNHSVGQDEIKMGNADCMGKAALYLICDAPEVMTGQVLDLFPTV